MFMTLDGVVQDPGGFGETDDGGWALSAFDEEAGRQATEQLERADYFLLGRTTFELLHGAWSANTGPYAERMNALPKLVASTTLRDPLPWNATVIEGDAVTAIADLRSRPGGDILMYGSVSLVRTLLAHRLVDELVLGIYPVVLGRGERLFGSDHHDFRLVDSAAASSGVTTLTYRRPDDDR